LLASFARTVEDNIDVEQARATNECRLRENRDETLNELLQRRDDVHGNAEALYDKASALLEATLVMIMMRM
jgi:hypothetical protein